MTDQLIYKIYKFAEKVQPIYSLIDWKWRNEGVPTVEQIVSTVKSLIIDASEHNYKTAATGGIFIRRDVEDETQWEFGMEIKGGFYFNSDISI